MNTYVVLLRGINVGGKNLLPMKELKALLIENGYENIETYIQSGNVVLQSSNNPEDDVASLIEAKFGFSLEVLALSEDDFNRSVQKNPYPSFDGKFVHFYYCKSRPNIDAAKLERYISDTERYQVAGDVFYLHAPNGIGRSKLVANIESCLGESATGRNLNTINKLKGMLRPC